MYKDIAQSSKKRGYKVSFEPESSKALSGNWKFNDSQTTAFEIR